MEQHFPDLHWQYFKLYKWKPIREKAAVYLKYSVITITDDCSSIIAMDKASQEPQRGYFIQGFEVVFIDRWIAKKEINKNTKSSQTHHLGAAAQQLFEQAEAINKNGVAKQWIIQMKLAIAPIKSDFCFKIAIIVINYCLYFLI